MKTIRKGWILLWLVLHAWTVMAWGQQDNRRYLALVLVNENEEENLNWIQAAHDNGCNAVSMAVQWGAIHGLQSRQVPESRWAQYDHQIAKARSLGMKIGLRIAINTSCQKPMDPGPSQYTCDGWLPNERMFGAQRDPKKPLLVYQLHGGPTRTNPDLIVDALMTSLAAQSTLDRLVSFTKEVIHRYKYLADSGDLLYVNLIYNRSGEAGYDFQTSKIGMVEALYDYSDPMVDGYRTWLKGQYRNKINRLNKSWSTTYRSFHEITPKRPLGAWKTAFQGPDGRDWFRYRAEVFRTVSTTFARTVRQLDARIKVISDYGSVFDRQSITRGSMDFPTIDAGMDGLKVNDDHYYDHRFAMDLLRSNMPGKLIMNEAGFNPAHPELVFQQLRECYDHGANLVAIFQLDKMIEAGHGRQLRQFSDQYINAPESTVPVIRPTHTASFTLSSLIDQGGCDTTNRTDYAGDCDAYKKWRTAYEKAAGPIRLILCNDLTGQPCAAP
ncbi:beta-galactosidase [Larkinella harenae]